VLAIEPAPPDETTLTELLERAEALVSQQERCRRGARTLEQQVQAAHTELTKARAERERVTEELQDFKTAGPKRCAGINASLTVSAAAGFLENVQKLFAKLKAAGKDQDRVKGMERDRTGRRKLSMVPTTRVQMRRNVPQAVLLLQYSQTTAGASTSRGPTWAIASMNMTAVRTPAKGTWAMTRPTPPRTDWPGRSPQHRERRRARPVRPAESNAPPWSCQTPSKTPRPRSRMLTVGVKECGKHHGQQKLQDQHSEATHFRDEPPDGAAAVWGELLHEILYSRYGNLFPRRHQVTTEERHRLYPGRRRWNLKGGQRLHPTAIRSAFDTIVPMANQRGTTRMQRRTTVITATASERRPQSRAWMEIINGQVAVTMVTAQMAAPRNG